MSTPEPDALTQTIVEHADRHVGVSKKVFGLNFDFSEDSLTLVDDAITKFHPDGNIMDSTILAYGSYIGETIRRNLGGVWLQDERGVAMLDQVGGVGLKVPPFSWARKRFDNGIEDSIAYKYAFIKSEIIKNGGQLPTPADTASASTYTEDPMLGPNIDRLGRAPILVFLLVAAVDGDISANETRAFRKILEASQDCGSPLMQAVIEGVTIPSLEEFFRELMAGGIKPLDELQSIRVILDENYGNLAPAFKEALVYIGQKVAEASGGFLGFGKKVSKDELLVITVIANVLGLIKDEAGEMPLDVAPEDLERLGRAPVIIFMAVANADGKMGHKELKVFIEIIAGADTCPVGLLRTALETATLARLDDFVTQITAEGFKASDDLRQTAQMLDSKYPQVAFACKQELLAIGRRIAEASGGRFFGFGKKISDQEMQVLGVIAVTLGLVESEEV